MRGKSVKEEYGGEGGLREDHSTGDGGLILGALLDLQRGVEFWSQDWISTGTGLLEVLGTGARISI
jgi:hypothetical protein